MVNRTGKARFLRVAGFAAGAVVVAGVAVVATASAAGMSLGFKPVSSSSAASTDAQAAAVEASAKSTVCSDFMKNFANEIHKSQAEINAAFQKAIADTLADEVKSKQITQQQADAIQKKLANTTPCTLPSTAGHAPPAPTIKAFMQQYVAAAASALGVSETQLKSDLAAGQSLSQVAAAQHVSEADFRTKLIANLKASLDKAVADKTLTAAQEQEILNRLQTGELPYWTLPAKRPKPTPAVPAA
jgi:hypothetical protein